MTVRLPEAIRRYAGDQGAIELEGSTVSGVLDALISAHPDTRIRLFGDDGRLHSHLHVFLEGTEVAADDLDLTHVGPDDEIDVLVAISGGSDAGAGRRAPGQSSRMAGAMVARTRKLSRPQGSMRTIWP